jgi:hypothetical protein
MSFRTLAYRQDRLVSCSLDKEQGMPDKYFSLRSKNRDQIVHDLAMISIAAKYSAHFFVLPILSKFCNKIAVFPV